MAGRAQRLEPPKGPEHARYRSRRLAQVGRGDERPDRLLGELVPDQLSVSPKPRAARLAQPTCPARVAAASGEGTRPVHLRPRRRRCVGAPGSASPGANRRDRGRRPGAPATSRQSCRRPPCRQLDWRWLGILNQDMTDMADAIALTTTRGAVDWLA